MRPRSNLRDRPGPGLEPADRDNRVGLRLPALSRRTDISSRVAGLRRPGRTVRSNSSSSRDRTDRHHRAITHEASHPTHPVPPARVPVPTLPQANRPSREGHLPRKEPQLPLQEGRHHQPRQDPTDLRQVPWEVLPASRRHHRDPPAQVHPHRRVDPHRDRPEATSILLTSSSSSDIRRHRMPAEVRTIDRPIRHRISTNQ